MCHALARRVDEGEPSREIFGRVRIRDVVDRSRADDLSTRGEILASFFDLGSVTSTPALTTELSEHCVGVVSAPRTSGRRVGIDVGTVEVDGTARGTITPVRTSTGVYLERGARVVSGAHVLTARARSPGEALFPTFEATIDPVLDMEVPEPTVDGDAALDLDVFSLAWREGDGDSARVSLDPVSDEVGPSPGGQVICVVEDRGCVDLPTSVTAFLLASRTDTFRVSASRIRRTRTALADDVLLELEVASEVVMNVRNAEVAP